MGKLPGESGAYTSTSWSSPVMVGRNSLGQGNVDMMLRTAQESDKTSKGLFTYKIFMNSP